MENDDCPAGAIGGVSGRNMAEETLLKEFMLDVARDVNAEVREEDKSLTSS